MASPATTPRLSRLERREELLDSAATILADLGPGGLTMERLAEVAGVSRALPYRHFDNAEQVLVDLFHREVMLLGQHVAAARSGIVDPRERLQATVAAYFDVVSDRRGLTQIFATVVTPIGGRRSAEDRQTQPFIRQILMEDVGPDPLCGDAAATVFEAALLGATDAWVRGQASKDRCVRTVVAIAHALAAGFGSGVDDV